MGIHMYSTLLNPAPPHTPTGKFHSISGGQSRPKLIPSGTLSAQPHPTNSIMMTTQLNPRDARMVCR